MRRGEEESAETHQRDPGANPDWLLARAPASEGADRKKEEERGDVITVGYKASLCRADAESVLRGHNIIIVVSECHYTSSQWC